MLLATLVLLGFLLPRVIPGSPLTLSAEEISAENLRLPASTFNRFTEYYAPDKSLGEQFSLYLSQLARGDWGYSFHYGLPVRNLVRSHIGWTLFLALTSLVLATCIGVLFGFILGTRQRWQAGISVLLTIQAVPAYLLAVLVQLIFAYQLGWFPANGAYPVGVPRTGLVYYSNVLRHAVLPLATLTLSRLPSIAVLTFSVVRRVKQEPYVEAACYHGVPSRIINTHYILLNSLPEIIGRLNIHLLYAISGALFVEMIFSYPGMGSLLREAVGARDYPLVQGIFLAVCLYCIAVNFVYEAVAGKIHPRLRA